MNGLEHAVLVDQQVRYSRYSGDTLCLLRQRGSGDKLGERVFSGASMAGQVVQAYLTISCIR